MCLILVAWRVHPKFSCIIAANRDEVFERATEPAHWWSDEPQILAGRDLAAGGTWLGVTRPGRIAALTNFRAPQPKRTDTPSRGMLVAEMLRSARPVEEDLLRLQRMGAHYNGFNMMISDGNQLGVYESVSGTHVLLGPGIYGLSNHLLDTPWPKVQKGKSRLQRALCGMDDLAAVLDLLRDDRPAHDDELPRTGVSLEWERLLSSAFVRGADYGTRSSTIVRVGGGTTYFDEWSWDPAGEQSDRRSFEFATA